ETFSGKISPKSDQYSLAIVYEELLTGQRPFNGKNARQLAQQHLQEEPDLRALPEGERPIVARALSKEPDKRFPTCLAFVRAIYSAVSRSSRPDILLPEPPRTGSHRPKTMVDIMEDVLLERALEPVEGASAEEVDLGAVVKNGHAGESGSSVSALGKTVAKPETGCLRPTLVLGLGNFGRRALLELRC